MIWLLLPSASLAEIAVVGLLLVVVVEALVLFGSLAEPVAVTVIFGVVAVVGLLVLVEVVAPRPPAAGLADWEP